MRKVLLTGASGFLGSRIVETWDNELGVLYASTGNPTKINGNNVVIINREAILDKTFDLTQFYMIINCAFPMTSDGVAFYKGVDYVRKLIIKAEESEVKFFVNISSQSVYDPLRETAAIEEDQLCLRDQYSVGKYMIESLLSTSCKKMTTTNIRLGSLIGVGLNARIVNRFASSAIKDHEIKVIKGHQLFQFLDVQDAAKGIIEFCRRIEDDGLFDVYNLGGKDTYDLLELANIVRQVGEESGFMDVDIMVEKIETYSNNSINSKRLRDRTKWDPEINIYDSVKGIFIDLLKHF